MGSRASKGARDDYGYGWLALIQAKVASLGLLLQASVSCRNNNPFVKAGNWIYMLVDGQIIDQ